MRECIVMGYGKLWASKMSLYLIGCIIQNHRGIVKLKIKLLYKSEYLITDIIEKLNILKNKIKRLRWLEEEKNGDT